MGYKTKGCLYVLRSGIVWKKYDGDENFYTEPLDLTKSVHRRLVQAICENRFVESGKHIIAHTESCLKNDDYIKNKAWLCAEKVVDEIIGAILKTHNFSKMQESDSLKYVEQYELAEKSFFGAIREYEQATGFDGSQVSDEMKRILTDMAQNLDSENYVPASDYVTADEAMSILSRRTMAGAVYATMSFVDIKYNEYKRAKSLQEKAEEND